MDYETREQIDRQMDINNYSKLIIIGDVHGRTFWRDAVQRNPCGKFIFLGDYLDPYPKEEMSDKDAFQGLEDIINFKKEHPDMVTLLWGNHDLHYLYPEYMGSRYDFDHAERNAHLFWDNQSLFQMAYDVRVGDKKYLFSHAGVGRMWVLSHFPNLADEDITANLLNDLVGYHEFMSALGDVSRYRGGKKEYGSMIWADPRELIEEENRLSGVIQVFGHTQLDMPINYEDWLYCLDCRQAFFLNLKEGGIYCLQDNEIVGETQ